MMHHRSGFTLTETLIIGTIFGLVLVVGSVVLSSERARSRDAIRIADMTRLASSFAILYAEKASYLAASTGCPEIGSDASSCAFKTQLTGLDLLKDPGSFHYVINRVPDKDNFGVSFQLERRHGTLAAGKHTLSKIGVQ